MASNKTLIGTITDKARATWEGELPTNFDDVTYRQWEKHWIDTAKAWRDELTKEGLTDTVVHLNKQIEFFERTYKNEK